MRSFVVEGNESAFAKYLDDFCKENSIPKYGVFNYPGPVGIGDIRQIKKMLAGRSSGNRVVVLGGDISIPAQNALLKSVEESEEDTYFLFSVARRDSLLPTVLSRCVLVRLEDAGSEVDAEMVRLLENWLGRHDVRDALKLSEYLNDTKRAEEKFAELLSYSLYNTADASLLGKTGKLSSLFVERVEYLRNNNLNSKLFWDTLFFEAKNAS